MNRNRVAAILYRFYDEAGELLYVGVTGSPWVRFSYHAWEKEWWNDVARIELARFDTMAAALLAETAAIKAENPRHNVKHSPTNPYRHAYRPPVDDGEEPLECPDDVNQVSAFGSSKGPQT